MGVLPLLNYPLLHHFVRSIIAYSRLVVVIACCRYFLCLLFAYLASLFICWKRGSSQSYVDVIRDINNNNNNNNNEARPTATIHGWTNII